MKRDSKERMTGVWKAQLNYLRTRLLVTGPSRDRRSGYTDERLRHHRTSGGASDSQLRWCDGTRSEVAGQLGGCKVALDHVVSAPNLREASGTGCKSMPALSALHASGKDLFLSIEST
jgi:hypothetical protein